MNFYVYGGMGIGAAWCFYKVSILGTMPFEIMPIMTIITVSTAIGAVIGFVIKGKQNSNE